MQEALSKISRAFDGQADGYDERYARNWVMDLLRDRFRREALKVFPPGARLLEIGCGTGIDTLFFAQQGYRVTATDPSPRMLEKLKGRLGSHKAEAELGRLSTRELSGWAASRAGAFDGIFAFWGPLNYDQSLKPLAGPLRRLLRPGGTLLFSSVNPGCLWEMGYHLLKGNGRKAFRRLSDGGVEIPVGGETLRAFCHRPKDILSAFRPFFKLRSCRGLAVFLPPPYLAGALGPPQGWKAKTAVFLEENLANWTPFSYLGDQVLLTLEAES